MLLLYPNDFDASITSDPARKSGSKAGKKSSCLRRVINWRPDWVIRSCASLEQFVDNGKVFILEELRYKGAFHCPESRGRSGVGHRGSD